MDNLEKKLNEIKLPDIEPINHKEKLGNFLFSQHNSQGGLLKNFFKKFSAPLPAAATLVAILLLIAGNIIFPEYNIAQAKEIALENPQVQELIKKGAEIKDSERIDEKAFFLMGPKKSETGAGENFLIEVNIKEKKVARIQILTERIVDISENEKEEVQKIISLSEASSEEPIAIEEINHQAGQLKIIRNNGGIEVVPNEKTEGNFQVKYKIGEQEKSGAINIEGKNIEGLKGPGGKEEKE